MPVDLWDAATWPSPSDETEVRARVDTRTRALRRRRTLPALAVTAALLVGVAAWPRPDSPTGVATTGDVRAVDQEEGSSPSDDGTTAAGTTAPPPSQADAAPGDSSPSSDPTAPVQRLLQPRFPATPAPSSGHPLLRDPEGDARIETGPDRTENDPSLDITRLDVMADATSLTTELRIADLGATPLAAFPYGPQGSQRYLVILHRDDDSSFSFHVNRTPGGAALVTAMFWSRRSSTNGADAPAGFYVEGVSGGVNEAAGTVRVTATFASMNEAMAQDTRPHAPIGLGTLVAPDGRSETSYRDTANTYGAQIDVIRSDDPDFVHRLGD